MLTVRVTNDSQERRVWNVEPYGDDVALLPEDVMTVEVGTGPDVMIDVRLNTAGVGEVLWITVDGTEVAPTGLKVNDTSIWPS